MIHDKRTMYSRSYAACRKKPKKKRPAKALAWSPYSRIERRLVQYRAALPGQRCLAFRGSMKGLRVGLLLLYMYIAYPSPLDGLLKSKVCYL